MTIISAIVGKNPLEGNESTKESEMQFLDAISKTTEWSLFVSKANRDIEFTVIQVCAPTSNTEEAEVEQFCEDYKTF